MARLTEDCLRRSGGLPGLFAPAYRHVGSSIYYPLRLPALNHNPGDIIGGLVVVALLMALNIRGLGESARLNFVLAALDLSTQILLVGVGFVLVLDPSLLVNQVHLGSVPSWGELIFALSLAMLAYTGIETLANMAEAARDPGQQVSR